MYCACVIVFCFCSSVLSVVLTFLVHLQTFTQHPTFRYAVVTVPKHYRMLVHIKCLVACMKLWFALHRHDKSKVGSRVHFCWYCPTELTCLYVSVNINLTIHPWLK